MHIDNKHLLTILWILYVALLGLVAATTPITPSEAYYFYHTTDIVNILMHLGYSLFPSEFGIRGFFLLIGFINAFFYYHIIGYFISRSKDRVLILWIYLLLPGVVTSTILANSAVLVSFLVLLVLYLYLLQKQWMMVLPLLALSLLHWSALFFYLSLFIYALLKREKKFLLVTGLTLVVHLYMGIGIPKTQATHNILELLGIYATVFSPLVFIYLVYTLYRILLRGERDILWFISFIALLSSLLLSLKYRIKIIDFSPYIMIAVILMIQGYHESLRVRIKRFQKGYRFLFTIVTITLILSTLSILLNKPIYRIVGKERYTLFTPVYSPFDRVQRLLKKGKNCVDEVNSKYLDQLKFYGIEKCF